MMRTTSPTLARFSGSCARNFTLRRTTFLYFVCALIVSTLTTIVLSIALETTTPRRSWRRPRSPSGFGSRVIVENLNIVKRHTKPRPIQNTSRMGGPTMTPGGVVERPAPQSQPKKKGKRLPRSLRTKKTRPTRERAETRKPIVRLEKPEHERGRRQERRGVVVSDAMDKTIVVKVDTIKAHPKYKKVVRRSIKFHAHDEQNSAKVGDVVRIVETRPVSKTKRWRLAEVVEVAK